MQYRPTYLTYEFFPVLHLTDLDVHLGTAGKNKFLSSYPICAELLGQK
jgi:hypothetical protein